MGQSLSQIYVHLVWSTKNRQPFLRAKEQRARVFAYIVGICRQLKSPALKIGGVADHVHLLCRLNKTLDVSNLVREIKSDSSQWIKTDVRVPGFYWQSGYGAFSISPQHVEGLKAYISNQEAHHKKVTFKDEFRRLCRIYEAELDERYSWT